MDIITVNNLVKFYKDKKALDGVSLTVKGGELFGLLGVNGAGKTTLIKILVGLSKKSGGSVIIDGKNLDEKIDEIKEIIMKDEKISSEINGRPIKKLIIVPKRLINIIL